MQNNKDWMKKIGFLVILAFLVRFVSLFVLRLFADVNYLIFSENDAIALNILSGKGYAHHYHNHNFYFFNPSPLLVYFQVVLHLITKSNFMVMEIIYVVMAAFSVIPLVLIAKKIFDDKTAFISGLLYCLHPGLIVLTSLANGFQLIVCFILIMIYLMVGFKAKRWMPVVIGILMGLGSLLRSTMIFLIPAFFIYLVIKKERINKVFFDLFIIVLLAMIVVSPWIYRGYKIYNRFIFITLSSAEHFWRGNNPVASGTGLTKDGKSILDAAGEDFKKKLYSLNEIEQHDFFRGEAIKYIKTHPGGFLKLTLRKFIYFWSFSPQIGLVHPTSWLIIYKLFYYFLAFFFILGVYFIFRNIRYVNLPIIVLLFSFFIIYSFVHSLFYVDTRHRWMIEPLLMIISSYGIYNLLKSCCFVK